MKIESYLIVVEIKLNEKNQIIYKNLNSKMMGKKKTFFFILKLNEIFFKLISQKNEL